MSGKKSPKRSDFTLLKRGKEVKEDHHLVANGRRRKSFQCLEANGRRRRRFLFTFSHFPPKQLYLNLHVFFL
jgi:hypothetical protein